MLGQSASLPCNITPPTRDDSVILIFWYLNESAKPIYTVDARTFALDKAEHSQDEKLTSRVTFHISYPIAFFRLNPVKEEDKGEYRCRVDFKRGRTRNTIIQLHVI
ncbi:cell adhesion molecule 1-like protein, partial [Dinothrombium tinctorium]